MKYIYVVNNRCWTIIRNINILMTKKFTNIKEEDDILIYYKSNNNGFIGVCKTTNELKEQKENIKLDKYIVNIKDLSLFKDKYKPEMIKTKITSSIKGNNLFYGINTITFRKIINDIKILENKRNVEKNEREIYEDKGRIPIFMKPCDKFIYSKNKSNMIEEFKKHYGRCQKCEIVNNNNEELTPTMNRQLHYKESNNDKYVDNYLISNKLINDDITIIHIVDGLYKKCFIIEW